MTKEQAIAKLKLAAMDPDIEAAHVNADLVLCDLLTALGYGDVVREYTLISKWYA